MGSDENISKEQHLAPQTLWDEERQLCVNAVESIDFNFQYNPNNGFIEYVHADVTVKDLDMSFEKVSDAIMRGRYQQFSVIFSSIDSSSSSSSSRRLLKIESSKKSGNPGYLFGFPTLAGTYFTANKTISFLNTHDRALSIMDTGINGQCDTVSPFGSVSNGKTQM